MGILAGPVRVAAAASMLLACGGSSARYMTEVSPPRALQAPTDGGLVVFVRPSGWGGGHADVLDENGRFVGRAFAAAHWAVAAPPGQRVFVIWAENTDAVQIDVAAGRIYFVEVAITPG